MKVILEKLKEASTWRGLTALAMAFGIQLSPELSEAIISAAMAVIGLILVVKKDSKEAKAG